MAAHGDRATRLALTVVVALLVSGCAASRAAPPPVTPKPSTLPLTAATTAATTTTAAAAEASEPLTGKEHAWLEALTKLGDRTDKILDKVLAVPPWAMTAARLRSLAGDLRACGRELARLGSPSDRLQPVYHLAQKACAQFDKGARCLATAAGLGTPAAGSAEERKLDRAVDCGLSAPETGSELLFDAELKGEEIEDAAG